jgi:hypothetical protein
VIISGAAKSESMSAGCMARSDSIDLPWQCSTSIEAADWLTQQPWP